MSWLFDDPTYLLIIGGIAVLGLLIALYNTGRALFLILAAAALALTAAGVLIERLVITDYERVEQTLYDGAAAVESNNPDRVQEFFASNASPSTRQLLGHMRQFKFDTIRLLKYEINMIPKRDPHAAKVNLTVWVQLKSPEGLARAGNVELRLVKEGDRWLVDEYALQGRE